MNSFGLFTKLRAANYLVLSLTYNGKLLRKFVTHKWKKKKKKKKKSAAIIHLGSLGKFYLSGLKSLRYKSIRLKIIQLDFNPKYSNNKNDEI